MSWAKVNQCTAGFNGGTASIPLDNNTTHVEGGTCLYERPGTPKFDGGKTTYHQVTSQKRSTWQQLNIGDTIYQPTEQNKIYHWRPTTQKDIDSKWAYYVLQNFPITAIVKTDSNKVLTAQEQA